MVRSVSSATKERAVRYVPLLGLIACWQVLAALEVLPARKVPAPIDVLTGVVELARVGLPAGNTLALHSLYSVVRVACGFAVALCVAVPLGIVLGWSRRLRAMSTPVIEILRPIPPLAWIPLAILWFGIGLQSATFIIFLGCFFPILLNTVSGVQSVDSVLIDAARSLGAGDRQIFCKVLIPAATPATMTGMRVGLGIGWMTLVAAEFTGVRSGYGLGYLIMTARDIQRPDLVIAGMIVIGLIGFLLDALLRCMEQRLLRWRKQLT